MKKIILILVIFIITIPSISFATSGACSYHNGVNCSAGASFFGKVQCNDGWINSSVNFSDTQECKAPSCAYPTYSSCDVEYAKQQAQTRIDNINLMKSRGALVQGPSDYTQDPDYLLCKHTQELYQAGQDQYNQCLADESKKVNEANSLFDAQLQIKLNDICVKYVGVGSIWDKTVIKDKDGLQCNPSKEQNFNKALDNLFYQALEANPDVPKNINKEAILKIATSPEFINTPVSDIVRKYALDNNLLPKATQKDIPVKDESIKNGTVNNKKSSDGSISGVKKEFSNAEIKKTVNQSIQIKNTDNKIQEEPTKKIKWYQKIFNWFKRK